jgi:hypothetical protein
MDEIRRPDGLGAIFATNGLDRRLVLSLDMGFNSPQRDSGIFSTHALPGIVAES